jgi:tRNA 2-selenouridine synthase
VEVPLDARIALLKDEYRHFLADPALLAQRLAPLAPLLGHDALKRWDALARSGEFDTLVGELLERHYDPMYRRSIHGNFAAVDRAIVVAPPGLDADAYRAAARRLMTDVEAGAPASAVPDL